MCPAKDRYEWYHQWFPSSSVILTSARCFAVWEANNSFHFQLCFMMHQRALNPWHHHSQRPVLLTQRTWAVPGRVPFHRFWPEIDSLTRNSRWSIRSLSLVAKLWSCLMSMTVTPTNQQSTSALIKTLYWQFIIYFSSLEDASGCLWHWRQWPSQKLAIDDLQRL